MKRPEPAYPAILLCTLGASWAVIPEVFGFLAPAVLPLLARHPRLTELDALRQRHALPEPGELWVVTSGGVRTQESVRHLRLWWQTIGRPMPLRVWVADGTDQLATPEECFKLRELTLRAVLIAVERAGPGRVVLSLAGGRKTMSADLQAAGGLFGAHAWLHVVGPDPMPQGLGHDALPATFAATLTAEQAAGVSPVVVGTSQRDDAMQVPLDGRRLDAATFPLPLPDEVWRWQMPLEGPWLAEEVDRRQRAGSQLLGNYLSAVARDGPGENWRSLYRLPPATIEALRSTVLGPSHRDWITALPKADLHRHLGGCPHLAAQRRVGAAVWGDLTRAERDAAMRRAQPLMAMKSAWPWDWPRHLAGPGRAAACAALLVHADDAMLEAALWQSTQPRIALKRGPRGFAAYERPGELSGSALLTHPAALDPYVEAALADARDEGLTCLELRGSPQKYSPEDPVGFVERLRDSLRARGARVPGDGAGAGPQVGFIWILDRRQAGGAKALVEIAAQAYERLDGFLIGLDLAGDEGTSQPEVWAEMFGPAFRECLSVTIHAGEDEPAENIWQAAYQLHADRIGHGLTLSDSPRLMTRFRDRGVCLELCPTSNREVVGFRDPDVTGTHGMPIYPLRRFLDAGLPLTLCTDNPGFSRSTLADEYLAASRMSPGGITQWEALSIIRQAFVHSFMPAATREALLQQADDRVWSVVEPESGLPLQRRPV